MLCLICRNSGHIASECHEKPNKGELTWFISKARENLPFQDSSASNSMLCRRCSQLNVLEWLREKPPLERDRDLARKTGDTRLFRTLGQVGSVELRDDCSMCYCIFGLIPNPTNLEQEIKISIKLVYVSFGSLHQHEHRPEMRDFQVPIGNFGALFYWPYG